MKLSDGAATVPGGAPLSGYIIVPIGQEELHLDLHAIDPDQETVLMRALGWMLVAMLEPDDLRDSIEYMAEYYWHPSSSIAIAPPSAHTRRTAVRSGAVQRAELRYDEDES